MNARAPLYVLAGALILGGCSSLRIINTGNSECEFRVHTDRARCLRNISSNEEALAARRKERSTLRESQEASKKVEAEDIEEIVPLGASYYIGTP
jgi:hypothetical protein